MSKQTKLIQPDVFGEIIASIVANAKRDGKQAREIIEELEQDERFGCFDGFGRRDQDNTRTFFNRPDVTALVREALERCKRTGECGMCVVCKEYCEVGDSCCGRGVYFEGGRVSDCECAKCSGEEPEGAA